MKYRSMNALSLVLIAGAFALGAALYRSLPAQVVSHWSAAGVPNGTMPKALVTLGLPLFVLVMYLIFAVVIPRIDPLRTNIASFRMWYDRFIAALVAFLVYAYVLTLLWNTGTRFDMTHALVPVMGVFIFFVGVLLAHAKRNWFIGIRTPWTLSSDQVWDETHRVAASLFKLAGIATALSFLVPAWEAGIVLVSIVGAAGASVVYSYVLWRRVEGR